MTNFSFGRTDGRTERGNKNIPELSLESAGIINVQNTLFIATLYKTEQNQDDMMHRTYIALTLVCLQ